MKETRIQHNSIGFIHTFSEFKNYKYPITFYTNGDFTNCKLSYIHSLGYLANLKDDDERKEVMRVLLRNCKGYVIINTTKKEVCDWLVANYPTYFEQHVPVGYYGGFQYVIAIKNMFNINTSCREPVQSKKTNILDKSKLAEQLTAFLKKKRRKADYVEEFLKLL